jgi:hypothetical protein
MEQELENRIEDIISRFECSKGFTCCTQGFENLCKAKDVGFDSILECLEEDGVFCLFSIRHGNKYYCECPLRVYIAKNLDK